MTVYCPHCRVVREVVGFVPLEPAKAKRVAGDVDGAVVVAELECNARSVHRVQIVIGKDWNNGRTYGYPRTRRRSIRNGGTNRPDEYRPGGEIPSGTVRIPKHPARIPLDA